MTPEEKAVIDLALYLRYCIDAKTAGDPPRIGRLLDAVDALIFTCPQCNAGGHVCPGDGNLIGHTQTDCGQHEEPDESDKRTADTQPCWECLTDPTEDPAPWCDCREIGERCKGPCRKRAHVPERCPNLSPSWRAKQAEESYRAEALKQEWVPATLILCLAGDHIRMGADETDVTRSSAGIWHADTSNAWHPKAWRHTELRMELAANPKRPGVENSGFCPYPPNLECEIFCTPERKATLLLQQAFPGSAIISSDVD